MADPKKPTGKKIIDVSHPGKTAPSGNSKSVIVTSRPIMKDPMVVEETAETSQSDASPITVKTGEAVIQPLGASEAKKDESVTEAPAEESKDNKTIADLAKEAADKEKPADKDTPKSDEEPAAVQNPEPAAEAEEPKAKETSDKVEEKSIQDKPENNKSDIGTDEKSGTQSVTEAEEAEALEREKHDQETQKLIDSKQYNLPINSVEKRRSKRVIVLGVLLSLILVLAWVDIALDASLIEINGVKPVTHFFSN